MMGMLNTTGLGAKDLAKPAAAFVQNKQNSSQEE